MILGLDQWWDVVIVFSAALLGGAINAIAGGGTVLTFPTLVGFGFAPITANIVNAIALWPGSFGGAWGFRQEIREARGRWLWLAIPSLLGGILGAFLLVSLPSQIFASLAPYLVLAGTALIALDRPIEKWLHRGMGKELSTSWRVVAFLVLLVVATYGGYFGASLGILVLTALSLVGVRDIHQANGLKNLFIVAIKGVAVFFFAVTQDIIWALAIFMAVGAIFGGYVAAVLGRRVDERLMRWLIVLIGIVMALILFVG